MTMTVRPALTRIAAALIALLLAGPARADAIADFYRGKTVSLYVSFPPAGGYDIYARVLAPHFSRHIPGNPAIVVRNMEGGSGVKAASYISTMTPQDYSEADVEQLVQCVRCPRVGQTPENLGEFLHRTPHAVRESLSESISLAGAT